MTWPGDIRPLWERALLARQLEMLKGGSKQGVRRVVEPEYRRPIGPGKPRNPFRSSPVSYSQIGPAFYIRYACGHVTRRKRLSLAATTCTECWREARERAKQ